MIKLAACVPWYDGHSKHDGRIIRPTHHRRNVMAEDDESAADNLFEKLMCQLSLQRNKNAKIFWGDVNIGNGVRPLQSDHQTIIAMVNKHLKEQQFWQ